MSIAVGKDFLVAELNRTLAYLNSNSFTIHLFQNDITITSNTVVGDFVEADFGGYDPPGGQEIASWPPDSAVYVSPRARALHPPITWTADGTSTNTIYGYFVLDNDGEFAWGERRTDGGVVVGTVAGDPYFVIPTYARRSEFNSGS